MNGYLRRCGACRRRIFRLPSWFKGQWVHWVCQQIIDEDNSEIYRQLMAATHGLVISSGGGSCEPCLRGSGR